MGTVLYMSPEQARGRKIDFRTDIFSLGVVLYELLTLRQPFTGETNSHAIVAILEKDPPPMSITGLAADGEIERITMRLLEKSVDRRYQTASDLVRDLKALQKRLDFEAELERTAADRAPDNATRIFHADSSDNDITLGNTIAVLPFLNMSRGEDGDYFSDGLAEELLNVLSKIRGLRVAARTSAFSFKGKQATISEIGRALNVASVLEGSIRTSGNRVRISVQLVKVADGYHLWSETYDRTMDDIFAVQDDIAQSVVEELRTRLLGENPGSNTTAQVMHEVAEAVKGRADNPEAQRLMLLGRYFLDRTTPEDTTRSIQLFKESLVLDPDYALGWAELGRAYSVQAGKAWAPLDEGYAMSREATERALALEPHLAEGHATLGRIQSAYDWDLRGAMASYEKALQLAPGSPLVLDGASVMKLKLGEYDEAIELSRRVLAQDPLSGAIWHNLGLMCNAAGQLTESEEAFGRALELSPQRLLTKAMLALVLLDQGRGEEAIAMAADEPDDFWRLWAQAIVLDALGYSAEADAALARLTGEHADGDAYQIAEVYSTRGETDAAFEWLERAIVERDPGVTHTKADPRFRPLTNDKRWPALLKKIGFEG
jgi:TolB-like protein